MYKNFFGSERVALLDWFVKNWLQNGPNVCFLEGFPGVGKSELASEIALRINVDPEWIVINYEVPDRRAGSQNDLWLEIADRLATLGQKKMQDLLLENSNPAYAVEKALSRKILIILDEAQRIFEADTGRPNDQLNGILQFLKRHALSGRILLLSDRLVERERWSESFAIKTLNALTPQEAQSLLDDRLGADLINDVPSDRKADLLRILGHNPRAIETLVASLHYEPLEEIIGHDPGLWEVRDRDVSPEFLTKLERQLLERTLTHLDELSLKRLTILAVYRGGFEVAAFEAACSSNRKEWRDLRYLLVTRFLVRHSKSFYSLHPVVREISVARLKTNLVELQLAHSRASEYYLRHFHAQILVLRGKPLTASFAELRYHLYHAGRKAELKDVAIRIADTVGKDWGMHAPLPEDKDEINEQIALLNVLLEYEGGYWLQYYLSRLLVKRDAEGDVEHALKHAEEAVKTGKQAELWTFLAQLQDKVNGLEFAIKTVLEGIEKVKNPANRTILYQLAAEYLVRNNEIDDAIRVLREGVLVVPPESGVSMLYIQLSNLLVQENLIRDALILLEEGIRLIPPDKNASSMYHRLSELHFENGNSEKALEFIELGLKSIPSRDLHPLFLLKAELLREVGNTDAAIATLKKGIEIVPPENSLFLLYGAVAEIFLSIGMKNEARLMIQNGEAQLDNKHGALSLEKILKKIDDSENVPRVEPSSSHSATTELKSILVLATEWFSKHGGLSSFNRELCQTLAKQDNRVICVVPNASAEEVSAAAASGVELLQGPKGQNTEPLSGLYRKLQLPVQPDVVIGHGRITGPAARVQIEDNFPNASRVHFVHMAPGEIEWFKGKADAALVAEAREREESELAGTATVVAAVGPRLYREVGNLLEASKTKPILVEFVPGCEALAEPRPCPPQLHCLLLGRAEDIELKGLDIAARALAIAAKRSSKFFEHPPELIVRGAPPGTGTALRETLKRFAEEELAIRVREYSSSESDIEGDLRRASLLLMPSRKEGFGLVALEALEQGTPILVSDQSGIGELIKKYDTSFEANKVVVETVESLSGAAESWSRAIEIQLLNRASSFERAWSLSRRLADEDDWNKSVRRLLSALQ